MKRRVISGILGVAIALYTLVGIPAFASVETDGAEQQAQLLSKFWEQSNKKATDYEHCALFEITAYCSCYVCSEGYGTNTSSGNPCQQGITIAVDNSLIPEGSEVLMGGHLFRADDVGGAIKGAHIDLYLNDHATALAWGKRYLYVAWNGGKAPSSNASGEPLTSVDGLPDGIKMGVGATGSEPSVGSSSDGKGALKDIIQQFAGTEDDIPGIMKAPTWGGSDVVLPTKNSLTSTEQQRLSQWGSDIKSRKESASITFMRALVSSFGLWVIVYCLFLYIFFWVDSINNLVSVQLLSLATGGKLVVSPDGKESTFNKKTGESNSPKLVVHKDIAFIVFVGITSGVLVLTGYVYTYVFKVLFTVSNLKSMLF